MTPGGAWTEAVLYSFAGNQSGGDDGGYPSGILIGNGGVLYGTTAAGGDASACYNSYDMSDAPPGCGILFSLTPPATAGASWTESVLLLFGLGMPYGLVTGGGGVFYGVASPYQECQVSFPTGSPACVNSGPPFVYSLTPPAAPGGAWIENVLYYLPASVWKYSNPVIGAGGLLYLTTYTTGPASGQVISLAPPAGGNRWWTATVLANFPDTQPDSLALGSGGMLYGTSALGILISGEELYGSVWSLTPPAIPGGAWPQNTLYNIADGSVGTPSSILAVGSDGTLYAAATTGACGSVYCGTLFSLTPPASPGGPWTETTLHSFTGGADGSGAVALVIGANGILYGITPDGGTAGKGSVFSIQLAVPQTSINSGGLVNAANYLWPVAPGSIAAVFGNFFRPAPASATESPLPGNLDDLSIQFGSSTLAPLFYVSDEQVNIQVPWELAGQTRVSLAATLSGQAGAPQIAILAPIAPGIFTTNSEGLGQGAILDASNRLVDSSNPATPGSTVLQIFCTGLGPVSNQPPSGSPAPFSPLAYTTTTPAVTIGGMPAEVSFSGLAPGYVGLYQVNAQVPAGLSANSATPVRFSCPAPGIQTSSS